MEEVLEYYKWLYEKVINYGYKSKYAYYKYGKNEYQEIENSLKNESKQYENIYPNIKYDREYIMNEATTVREAENLLEERIWNILSELTLIEDNSLIKELNEIYTYLEYLNKNIKEYNENDYFYNEIVRVCNELIENEKKGRYDSIKDIYYNLREVFKSDKELLTQKRKIIHYEDHTPRDYPPFNYLNEENEIDLNKELIEARESNFSSYVQSSYIKLPNKNYDNQFKNFFYPIIKQCKELKEYGQYDKIKGFNHFIVNYNDVELHVYQNYHDLFISDKELDTTIYKPYNEENGYIKKEYSIDKNYNTENILEYKNLKIIYINGPRFLNEDKYLSIRDCDDYRLINTYVIKRFTKKETNITKN